MQAKKREPWEIFTTSSKISGYLELRQTGVLGDDG